MAEPISSAFAPRRYKAMAADLPNRAAGAGIFQFFGPQQENSPQRAEKSCL